MSKPTRRTYSRYARDAVELLGQHIRNARITQGMTVAELAERAGVSRGLVHRVEGGEMGSAIGVAFELAVIIGVPLFDATPGILSEHLRSARERRALLPKAVRHRAEEVDDDF